MVEYIDLMDPHYYRYYGTGVVLILLIIMSTYVSETNNTYITAQVNYIYNLFLVSLPTVFLI